MSISQFENEYIYNLVNSLIDIKFDKCRIVEIILWDLTKDGSHIFTEEQQNFLIDRCFSEVF